MGPGSVNGAGFAYTIHITIWQKERFNMLGLWFQAADICSSPAWDDFPKPQVDHMCFACWNGQPEDQPCTSECRECWLAKCRFPNMGVPPNQLKLDNFSTETYGFGDLPF